MKTPIFVSLKVNYRLFTLAVKAGFVYALLLSSALALPTFTITEIGFTVSDINNNGQVAGTGVNSQGKTHAFRYTDGIGYEDLGVAPSLAPAVSSTANGINDRGQVVGRSGSDSFRYTDGVGMVDLSDLHCTGFLDTCIGSASEINNSGQVIGWWYSNETLGGQRAVRFTDGLAKELFELLSSLESWSFGVDINDAGQSVGYTVQLMKQGVTIGNIAELKHAFRFTDGVGMEFLGTLGGSISVPGENSFGNSVSAAFGINTAGQVTGQSSTTSLRWHGFLYTDGVGMQDLGVLQGDDASVGIEINDSGHVVGRSFNTNSGIEHPVLWTRPGCPEDLNAAPGVKGSGWILGGDIRAVNNKGQIVGNGTNPAGMVSGYRLTPIAASGVPQCSIPATTTPGSTATIDPTTWKNVRPLLPCTTKVCKAKWIKNRKLLKNKALAAIRTQKASEKSPANARKRAIANKARNQYNRVVSIIQGLHN